MSNDSARIPATRDLLLGSLEIGLHRTVDRFAQEVGGGPQGRDTSRAYPGEALLQRLDKTPDRLAAAVAEPHIPGLSPKPEPEQIDMRLDGRHQDSSPLVHSNPAEWDRDWQAAGGRTARNNDRDR
jgi:hypothetical protein